MVHLVFHSDHPTLAMSPNDRGAIVRVDENGLLVICPQPFLLQESTEINTVAHKTRLFDGVSLRIFHYNDKWVVSTASRVDARDACWASKRSFHDLMLDALLSERHSEQDDEATMQRLFDESLNRDEIYTVLLLHPEHPWILYNPRPALVLCDIYTRSTHTYATNPKSALFPGPEAFDDFPSKGFTWLEEDGIRVKWESPDFVRAQELRLNRKDIAEAYVHQWPEAAPEFYRLFPWAAHIFRWWDRAISYITLALSQAYNCPELVTQDPLGHLLTPMLARLRKYVGSRRCTYSHVTRIVNTWHTLDFMHMVRKCALQ